MYTIGVYSVNTLLTGRLIKNGLAMLKDLSYGAFGLLVMAQKEFGDRPFVLKDVLNRGESSGSTKRLLRELVDEGFLSSGQLRQVATGYFSIPQYRLIQELPITFIEDEPEQSVDQPDGCLFCLQSVSSQLFQRLVGSWGGLDSLQVRSKMDCMTRNLVRFLVVTIRFYGLHSACRSWLDCYRLTYLCLWHPVRHLGKG